MMEGKQIANLFATLGFKVQEQGLEAFLSKLKTLETRLSGLQNKALKITISKADTKELKQAIRDDIAKTSISLTGLRLSKTSVNTVMKEIKAAFANGMADIKAINVQRSALNDAKKKISDSLSAADITVNVKGVTAKSIKTAKAEIKRELNAKPTELENILVKTTLLNQQLNAWRAGVSKNFVVKVRAEIAKARLASSLRDAINHSMTTVGQIKLKTPDIKVGIDKQHLKQEIADALAQIRREVRIKMDLTTNTKVSGHGASASPYNHRRTAFGAGAGGAIGATTGLLRGALPGLGAGWAAMNLNRINQELQSQQMALTAVTGSDEAAGQHQAWVKEQANRIGLDYRQMTPAYTRMLASGTTAGMSESSVQNIFKGVSEYGRVMGLDSDSMKGGMRAIEQMMNKGQIYSEELKGQLAERMPGVISAMAEAAGFGKGAEATQKLFKAMEDGEVKSQAVLEKFAAILAERARKGDALEKAMASTAAQQMRFNNAFSDAVTIFAEGGFDSAMARFFDTMRGGLEGSDNLVKALGNAFKYLTAPFEAAVNLIRDFSQALPDLSKSLGISENAIVAIGGALAIAMLPFGPAVLAIGALVVAAEDFVSFLQGKDSVFGRFFDGLTPETQESLTKLGTELVRLGESVGTVVRLVGEGWGNIFSWFTQGDANSVIDILTKMVNIVNELVAALRRLANGDWQGTGEAMGNAGSSALGVANSMAKGIFDAADMVIPFGDPFAWMTEQTRSVLPSTTAARRLEAQKQAEADMRLRLQQNQQTPGVQNPDVPMLNPQTKVDKIEIIIDGAADPEAVAQAVEQRLNNVWDVAKTNLGGEYA